MSDNEAICYSKNFINQVLVRIDFLKFIPDDIISSEHVIQKIIRFFPRIGKEQILRFNTVGFVIKSNNMKPSDEKTKTIEGHQREYTTSNGNNKLTLSNQFIVFLLKEYDTFENHFKCIRDVVGELFQNDAVIAARTGIRYINMYESTNIVVRKKYFAPEIAAAIISKAKLDAETNLIRSMHINEYRFDTMTLNFRFGMFNPEYPSFLKKNAFVLDFDCFTTDTIDKQSDILECIINGHSYIQELFEQSITDEMRKEMNS